MHVRIRGVRIADVMLLDPVLVEPTTSVESVRMLLRRSAQRVFPIVGSQGYAGMRRGGLLRTPLAGDSAGIALIRARSSR